MMVMPMRTYRALWIMELSTPKPLIPPGLVLLPPLSVVFTRLEFVTAGLGAAVLLAGATSAAANRLSQHVDTITTDRTFQTAIFTSERSSTLDEQGNDGSEL
ncbi:hypothetical protein XENOCAPTIV_021188 [Xenoophorus captivus]|uniref:Uncharacterized protein n=1 Tax=Xenoophorus captivus TaxID=1517983 RepID=A0ABV0SHN9_9TELE